MEPEAEMNVVERRGSFAGEVAIITGGGGGIGQAVGQRLALAGARVAVVDVNESAAQRVAAEIGEAAFAVTADCAAEEAVGAAVRLIEDRLGPPSILIQSAGVADPCPADRLDRQAWTKTIAVNLTACFNLLEACVPGMIERRRGRILHIASIAGHRGAQNRSVAYAASKGGLIAMTRILGTQLGPYGINVNSLSPGIARSELSAPFLDAMPEGALAKAIPLGRAASVDEMAEAAVFLVSPGASYVNAVDLIVDGGLINSYRV